MVGTIHPVTGPGDGNLWSSDNNSDDEIPVVVQLVADKNGSLHYAPLHDPGGLQMEQGRVLLSSTERGLRREPMHADRQVAHECAQETRVWTDVPLLQRALHPIQWENSFEHRRP
jgi:hypothetical protein